MSLSNKTPINASASDDISFTGSIASGNFKVIIFPFNQYELKIKLTAENKFVEVLEVKINKDFLSHQQKMASLSSLNIEQFL